MRNIFQLSLMVMIFFGSLAAESFPPQYRAGESNLVLNGIGLRKKMFFKIYQAGLYLPKKSQNFRQIIQADEPMIIRMVFIYDEVEKEKLIGAWNEGFEKSTDGKTTPLKPSIDQFNACFSRSAFKDDVYDLIYLPQEGVKVIMNDTLKATIPGLNFKKALWGIWLGDKPVENNLKEGMLDVD